MRPDEWWLNFAFSQVVVARKTFHLVPAMPPFVMAGLDPAIHLLRKTLPKRDGTRVTRLRQGFAGSSVLVRRSLAKAEARV